MNGARLIAGVLLFAAAARAQAPAPAPAKTDDFYALKANSIEGQQVDFSRYKGRVLLIVNTASKCGFTPQYQGLQALQDRYAKDGFTVLGFPSNDFFWQEPASNPDIKKFCELRYGVTFPLFEKGHVKGKNKQDVYRFLLASDVGKKKGEIGWNFVKFLVDKDGRVAERFTTRVDPLSPEVTGKIDELLRRPSTTLSAVRTE